MQNLLNNTKALYLAQLQSSVKTQDKSPYEAAAKSTFNKMVKSGCPADMAELTTKAVAAIWARKFGRVELALILEKSILS